MDQGTKIELTTPVEALGLRGRRMAPAMRALGVSNVGQLIAYLPTRHEFNEAETAIGDLLPDRIVTARGEITATRVVMRPPRPRFEAVLADETGRLELVWFNALYMRDRLHPGMRVRVQGKAKRFKTGLQLANPGYEVIREEADEPAAKESRLRPVYPAGEGLSSRQIEGLIGSALGDALPLIEDHLPPEYRRERDLPELREAYRLIHAPAGEAEVRAATRRLAYDEFLLLQLGVQMKRAHLRRTLHAPSLKWNEGVDRHIRERIPFTLTAAQDAVVADIARDLSSSVPTNRLIQGDVGSGKTAVALYAMLMAAAARQQSALMAPTELLAEQHFGSISRMLEGSTVKVELLTGTMAGAEREGVLRRLASGDIDIVIGTHALLTEGVRFESLALAIVDEQHRFGVFQRAALRTKTGGGGAEDIAGELLTPHVLVMTATPIPRTLALTLFGDLDVSVISGLPPGRKPIKTRVVGPDKSAEVYGYVRKRVEEGDQAYVVVPAIDTADEEMVDLRTIVSRLETHELAGRRVAAVHGRLNRTTREHIMYRFRKGLIDVLVATTVIEVGVDVPNATVMVVEHAERFGLAQLHQLRGRVGRGQKPSVCVLIGEPTTEDGSARLRVMEEAGDGFTLAEKDLEIRGPGEVFGTRQSGMPPFKVADLMRDRDLLGMARRDAIAWIERSPGLMAPDEAFVRRRLLKTHGKWLGIGDVG